MIVARIVSQIFWSIKSFKKYHKSCRKTNLWLVLSSNSSGSLLVLVGYGISLIYTNISPLVQRPFRFWSWCTWLKPFEIHSSQMKSKRTGLFFQKSTRGCWACSKIHQIKKRTPLWKTNFLRYTTLLLGPKRFVNSKGPKIALCLC